MVLSHVATSAMWTLMSWPICACCLLCNAESNFFKNREISTIFFLANMCDQVRALMCSPDMHLIFYNFLTSKFDS